MQKTISILGNHGVQLQAIAKSWNWIGDKLIIKFFDIFEGDLRERIVPELKKLLEQLNS